MSGEATNVIPDTAVIKGTVRTYDEEARTIMEQAMKQMTKSTCEGQGYVKDCPSIWIEIFGNDYSIQHNPMMGSENFSF